MVADLDRIRLFKIRIRNAAGLYQYKFLFLAILIDRVHVENGFVPFNYKRVPGFTYCCAALGGGGIFLVNKNLAKGAENAMKS